MGTTLAFCRQDVVSGNRYCSPSVTTKSSSFDTIELIRIKELSLYEKRTNKVKGVYSRPSAAIERGSGFYIPGLEGYRVRIVSGAAILALSYLNSAISSSDALAGGMESSHLQLSMNLANGYGILLLFQALVDLGKETLFDDSKSGSSKSVKSKPSNIEMNQIISPSLVDDEELSEAVRWAAATFLSLTPASNIVLINSSGVMYNLGQKIVEVTSMDGVSAALETLSKSQSGRVAVPSSHPSTFLVDEDNRRCVILQKVNDQMAIVVGSDQLLQSFTKSDLKWLGSFSKLLNE